MTFIKSREYSFPAILLIILSLFLWQPTFWASPFPHFFFAYIILLLQTLLRTKNWTCLNLPFSMGWWSFENTAKNSAILFLSQVLERIGLIYPPGIEDLWHLLISLKVGHTKMILAGFWKTHQLWKKKNCFMYLHISFWPTCLPLLILVFQSI